MMETQQGASRNEWGQVSPQDSATDSTQPPHAVRIILDTASLHMFDTAPDMSCQKEAAPHAP